MLTILFDGIAYGMLLFVLACGLAVTLGLMNFVNLAHGAFAMAGGYCLVVLVNRWGVPFFAALPLAFLASAVLGFVLERTLYVHVYRKPHLDQVLFTIGLVFMSVAAVDYVMGSGQVFARVPSWLEGQINVMGGGLGRYVSGVFAPTFAFGSGRAGLGGALGVEILGLDPTFPLKYMIYFLIVVTVGGTTSITGPFLASLLLGIS